MEPLKIDQHRCRDVLILQNSKRWKQFSYQRLQRKKLNKLALHEK